MRNKPKYGKRYFRRRGPSLPKRVFRFLFMEYADQGNNHVCGPGFVEYGSWKFSWGKLAVALLVLAIAMELIMFNRG